MTRGAVTWESLSHLPVVLTAVVACAVLAVVVYRPQLRRAGWFWRWVVPGFRVTAIAALLTSALKPSILRPAAPEDIGAVVVVLDDSASMSVTDGSWTPAELVAVADALHELPPGVARWSGKDIDDRIARIRPLIDEAARAASELEYARVAGRSAEAASRRATQTRAALISAARALAARAGSAAEALKPALARWADAASVIDTKGRGAWAELRGYADATVKAVAAHQADADARLYAQDARVRETCDGLSRLSRIDLARRVVERTLLPGIPADVPVRVVTASEPTRILIAGAAARPVVPGVSAEASRPDDLANAIRLVAQPRPGRDHRVRSVVVLTDGCPRDAASPVPSGAPPIIACRTAPAAVRDVSIERVATPDAAYAGTASTVRVDLRAAGFAPGSQAAVTVACDGALETRNAALDAERVSVDVPFHPTRTGTARLAINVAPLGGEATAANNSAERSVRVLPGDVGVLALTSDGSTAAAGGADLRDVLAHVPGIAPTVVTAGSTGQPAAATPAEILARRVVVLQDVSAESLSAEQVDAIRELVSDRGGTLLLVAGRSHWPLDDESEALLDDLLPYRLTSTPTWRSSFGRPPVRAAGAAAVPPALARIPSIGRFLQLGDLRTGVRPLVVDQDTGSPLLTEEPVGKGRVLTLTADDTSGRGAAPQFWAALIHYAADAPYAVEADGYALDADRPDVGGDDTVIVRAKIPAEGRALARPPSILVVSDGRVVRTEPLTPAAGPDAAGQMTATVGGLPGGDYAVRLDTGIDDELAPLLEVPLHVRPPAADELADVTPDPAFLRDLAEPTGGAVVPLTDAARLPADAARGRADRPRTVEYALWDSPYLFLFVTACLTAEWALRKRLGLA